MAAFVDSAQGIGTALSVPASLSAPATVSAASASAGSIRTRLSNLWPPTLIVLGLVLTLLWNAGLLLLLVWVI